CLCIVAALTGLNPSRVSPQISSNIFHSQLPSRLKTSHSFLPSPDSSSSSSRIARLSHWILPPHSRIQDLSVL
ncbi:unnamed protein product, partial [Citrullus colocynthis]